MVIKNGIVVTENKTIRADVRIKGDKIVEIGRGLRGRDVIDAKYKCVMPGGVDVHTHFDLDVGIAVSQDDFHTGTVAAACGGTTTIVDHIGFGPKGCSLDHQIGKYHGLAKGKAVIDYGFHGVIQHLDDDVLTKMESLMQSGITSYKIYMTYDFKMADEQIYEILRHAKKLGLMIAVHPENDGVVNKRRAELVAQGKTAPIYHAISRPEPCEAEAINRVLQISAMAGDAPVYIVHLSSHLAMEYVDHAEYNGMKNVFVETCPQYLMLDDDLYNNDDGLKYVMSPPLRALRNNKLLWKDIEERHIDTIGTDHCPFDYKLKRELAKDDFTKCPGGAPGVELRMPIMFSEGVIKRRIPAKRIAEMCCTNPAKLFGMYPKKGVIRVGSDADITIINLRRRRTVRHKNLHERVDYTPYEGLDLLCTVDTVISRGEVIVKNNEYIGKPGRGEFVKRGKPILID